MTRAVKLPLRPRLQSNVLFWSDLYLSIVSQIETPSKVYLEFGYLQTKPFYREVWFVVALAAASIVIIIMVVAILCVKSKTYKYKGKKKIFLRIKLLSESWVRCVAGSAAGRHATLPGPRPRCPEHRNIVLGCSAARVSTLRQQQPPRHMTDGCCFPVSVCPIIFVILATVERKISLFLSAVNWGKFQLLSITLKILRLVKLRSVRSQGCIFGGFSFKAAKDYI